MKEQAFAVAVLCVFATGCTTGGDTHGAPQAGPTLPPVSAFRDGLLYAAIKARLAGTDIDSTTRVSVAVHDGHVTLSGIIKNQQSKERDVTLVRRMRGVKSVDDQLRVGRVGPSAAQVVGDAAIVAAVASALAAQTGINVAGVRIRADNGTVTLAGHAATAALKSTMIAAAKKTPGVRNVVDRIAVR